MPTIDWPPQIPYINPDVRYVGVSWLRKMNAESLAGLKAPTVLKREDGTKLAVLVPWETYLALQDEAGAARLPREKQMKDKNDSGCPKRPQERRVRE